MGNGRATTRASATVFTIAKAISAWNELPQRPLSVLSQSKAIGRQIRDVVNVMATQNAATKLITA